MQGTNLISLLKNTYTKWSDHQAPRLGASVAFYSILSFAPLLVLITAVIALVLGHKSAEGALVSESRQWVGDRGADTVQTLLKNAQKPASGAFAGLVAFLTLLFGASGVFTELRDALNLVWDAKGQESSGFIGMIKDRLFSFGMVLSIGFLLLVSLILSAALAFLGASFKDLLPVPSIALQAVNFAFSFGVITVLFALMFRYVPAVKISWRHVWVGAVGTAFLFTLGKFLLGLYLGKASVGSTYGAAGSFVAMIVWIYYSAQIFFFGAQFTRVYADAHGAKVESSAPGEAEQAPTGSESKPMEEIRTAPTVSASGASLPAAGPRQLSSVSSGTPALAQAGPSVRLTGSAGSKPKTSPRPPDIHALPVVTRQTKPRLLMAAGLGFVIGRVVGAMKKNSPHPHYDVRE
jgi:membrane protein